MSTEAMMGIHLYLEGSMADHRAYLTAPDSPFEYRTRGEGATLKVKAIPRDDVAVPFDSFTFVNLFCERLSLMAETEKRLHFTAGSALVGPFYPQHLNPYVSDALHYIADGGVPFYVLAAAYDTREIEPVETTDKLLYGRNPRTGEVIRDPLFDSLFPSFPPDDSL